MTVGVRCLDADTIEVSVWAPFAKSVAITIESPVPRTVPLDRSAAEYWTGRIPTVPPGALYRFLLDGEIVRPDPASQYQPVGVHGASGVVDQREFRWDDREWTGLPLETMVIYELHVGAFSPEGTFDAIIPKLQDLKALGVNAIEIMPVAQFPGDRNWGYDGVYPFAVQHSYGGPSGLKRLVNACHLQGISVVLDVVYNHLGPEGNYLADFGPYFTDRYRTPWGRAINFDGPWSDGVRNYFLENALFWFREYHIDALRVDAVHAIFDLSAVPFLKELALATAAFSKTDGRKRYLIAESNLNDSKIIRSFEEWGYGFDGEWCDDFHHCVHTLLTGEKDGYYIDFGDQPQLVKCLREGSVFTGQYSQFRKRRHGNSFSDRPASQIVICSQNHDQVGNRMHGERLAHLVSFEASKLAAGIALLSPYVPLLFMGEEYAEESPFLFFVSHTDRDLIEAVRRGRREEFRSFQWAGEPPDPQDERTFQRSRLHWESRTRGRHAQMLLYYTELLRLRRNVPALSHLDKRTCRLTESENSRLISIHRWKGTSHATAFINLSSDDTVDLAQFGEGEWRRVLDSAGVEWGGPGSAAQSTRRGKSEISLRGHSVTLYVRE